MKRKMMIGLIGMLLLSWRFNFYLISDRETELQIGMDSTATIGYDRGMDVVAPPLPPEGSHSFIEYKADDLPFINGLWKDVRPLSNKASWSVKTLRLSQPIQLVFNYDNLPAGQITIDDTINLREHPEGTIDLGRVELFSISYDSAYHPLAISEKGELPTKTALKQISPNPFNRSTKIHFSVGPGNPHISLDIYNILGEHIKTLWDGKLSQGNYEIIYDGTGVGNQPLTSGLFLCKIASNSNTVDVKKVLVIK